MLWLRKSLAGRRESRVKDCREAGCVYAGGVYLQPFLGGQVHRQTSLPSSLLPPVMDKTQVDVCVCRRMPAGVGAVLMCHSIVPALPFA